MRSARHLGMTGAPDLGDQPRLSNELPDPDPLERGHGSLGSRAIAAADIADAVTESAVVSVEWIAAEADRDYLVDLG